MSNYSKNQLDEIFDKGEPINGENPAQRRKDSFGFVIDRAAYGDRNSKYCWDVDHIQSKKKGGSDKLSNLQPLHCENNRRKGSS